MHNDASENVELFSAVVGLLFGKLYASFPMPMRIEKEEIAKSFGNPQAAYAGFFMVMENVRFDWFLDNTLHWLQDEGFIKSRSGSLGDEVVLTSKAFAVMKAPPRGLGIESGKTLGSELSDRAKDFGREVGTDFRSNLTGQIADFGGQVMSGFVKNMFS